MASEWATLNPNDLVYGALDASQLVFTPSFPSGSMGYARATAGQLQGKYYFEVQRPATGFDYAFDQVNCGITLATATAAQLKAMSVGAFIAQFGIGGQGVVNGVSEYASPFAIEPSNMSFAVDLNNGLFWMRPTPTLGWNNGNGGDPVAGTGGYGLGIMKGQLVFPVVEQSGGSYEPLTCNFGQSAFLGVVPSGYTPGWPGTTLLSNVPQICIMT